MNVLWIVNTSLPEASLLMNEKPMPYGGWLVNSSVDLSKQDDIILSIAFSKQGSNKVNTLYGEKIRFYSFLPFSHKMAFLNSSNSQLEEILRIVQPDIVHIFGTEYPHTLAVINACSKENIKAVISIQGLVSLCSRHYMASIPEKVQRKFTFRDFVKQDNLKQQQKKFDYNGKLEIQAIKKVKHIIGRTTFDKACSTQINPDIQYHFCNETLREEFYKHVWSLEKCQKHSIFVSQATYPIKGLHYMLEAMPQILKKFPNAKLYVAGTDITKSVTLKEKLKKTSYSKYITELIQKYDLKHKVIFTGTLDEKQMCEIYLKSNVFVCPSSIENSPNSLGEAMILGVPCVASDVGGVSDMLKHKEEGYVYQADAPYMLAYYICEIFNNKELTIKLSQNAREHALKTHNRDKNTEMLIALYKNIIMDNSK